MNLRTSSCFTALLLALSTGIACPAGTLVRFRTVFGDMLVELYDDEKPATVRNFLRYVESGRWAHLFTHRVVPGFVVQAGGFVVIQDPVRGAEFWKVPKFDPIPNEFNLGPRRSNGYGTIAMARNSVDPDSATTDWFFNLADNASELDHEDGGFTVFGHVVSGTHVLESFNGFSWRLPLSVQPTNRLYYLGDSGPFNMFPLPPAFPTLLPLESATQAVTNVVHFEISVIPLEARPLPAPRTGIQWTGVPGVTNHVETAGNPSGAWLTLTHVVPDGLLTEVVDPSPSDEPRYYRIRIGD